ncbi:hypothetical protein C772_01163 [Bhargavaea cecembensis DSE10]|uniref:Uncharacterized protein n=1 Tax=Bhargavaea cecembensis DSE10 TaxID=1235279 RepID=M7NIE3_9BACL|nr:hypothetical protein [Bhargavaea cecembensis]EMR07027.1 hypothetical protein C772_01163 [Bhargavaea cecembensis DSE10]
MGKIFICSNKADTKSSVVVLELPTSQAAKDAFREIRGRNPKLSLGVYGSRDLETFKRTQRTLGVPKVVRTVNDFVASME